MLNNSFCLSVGSKIIADCGASSSGGAKAFTDGQRSRVSGDPTPGQVWTQKSEALIIFKWDGAPLAAKDFGWHFCTVKRRLTSHGHRRAT